MTTHTTQVIIEGIKATVTQGWDPVLHRFFFVIEKETDWGAPTYSNLDRNISEADYQNLDYFKKVAKRFNVFDQIPSVHWEDMRIAQLNDD